MPKYAKLGVSRGAATTGSKTPANADDEQAEGGM